MRGKLACATVICFVLLSLCGTGDVAQAVPVEGISFQTNSGSSTFEGGFTVKYVKRVLTADEMKNLFSTPITIIAARSGYWHYVLMAVMTKDSADVFTGGSGKNLQVQWAASTGINAAALNAGYMETNTVGARFQLPAQAILIDEAAASAGGKAVVLNISGSNMAGTGSQCTLALWYIDVPDQAATLP